MLEIEGGNGGFSWQIAEVRRGEQTAQKRGAGEPRPSRCTLHQLLQFAIANRLRRFARWRADFALAESGWPRSRRESAFR